MEMVRTVKVIVEVETNKQTIRKEYASLTEAFEKAEGDFGELSDALVEDVGCEDDEDEEDEEG